MRKRSFRSGRCLIARFMRLKKRSRKKILGYVYYFSLLIIGLLIHVYSKFFFLSTSSIFYSDVFQSLTRTTGNHNGIIFFNSFEFSSFFTKRCHFFPALFCSMYGLSCILLYFFLRSFSLLIFFPKNIQLCVGLIK